MTSFIQTLSDSPFGLWGSVFAFFSLLLIIVLVLIISNRAKSRDELLAMLEQKMQERANAQSTEIQTALSDSVQKSNTQLRMELNGSLDRLSQSQNQSMVAFTDLIQKMNQGNTQVQLQAREALKSQVTQLSAAINQELAGIRATLNNQLQTLQTNNDAKLEMMRQTVETKLQTTLETRLSESFKQVASHLKDVETGLGEMRTIAGQVGELKRVLTNVKTRGTFGEVQLGTILANIIPNHYEENVATRPNSNERVEFAIKMPGASEGEYVWLPIDSKFPVEDYQKIEDAREAGDAEAAERYAKAFENRIKAEAKKIHEKYVEVPFTTEFALMFLPSESLYAECLKRPGIIEELQNNYRVTVAGPTVLSALLNSLQMGFRTLAIQKRSAEVWTVLGQVKTEFMKFAQALDTMEKRVDGVKTAIAGVRTRTNVMGRKLRNVEELPGDKKVDTVLPADIIEEE